MTVDNQVLIIDDEPSWVDLLERKARRQGYQVQTAYDAAHGTLLIEQGFDGVVLLDMRLPDGDGLEMLETFLSLNPDLRIIMMTAYGTESDEMSALNRGVHLFVSKSEPKERFIGAIQNAFEARKTALQLRRYHDLVERRYRFATILSRSPQMEQLFEQLSQIVDSKVSVLLQGESGTGKELVARALHFESSRRSGPFVAVNCGGIPENLLESELFGHERGAFTGALQSKKGKFEVAHGGTLFLDEIGEMPLHLQVKLLRVLQERQVERVGGSAPKAIDVRIISATHRDLSQMVAEQRFREDLFYRLAVFPVRLPALRERQGDIPLLSQQFLEKALQVEGRSEPRVISPEAMRALEAYLFPGNVRELENVMSRAVLVSNSSHVTLEDLPQVIAHAMHTEAHPRELRPTYPQSLEKTESRLEGFQSLTEIWRRLFPQLEQIPTAAALEDSLITHALQLTDANVTLTAQTLGLSRATVYRRLRMQREQKP